MIDLKRKVIRKFSQLIGCNYESLRLTYPVAIISGYTRSGTTFLGRILSAIIRARYIHEPLNPALVPEISFFYPRESKSVFNDDKYLEKLRWIFGPTYNGPCDHSFFFMKRKYRIVKIVRGNPYLDVIYGLFPNSKFIVIIRNMFAAIASREKLNFNIPDQSKVMSDIINKLNKEQRVAIQSATGRHTKLALTWAIDNYLALQNIDNPNFKFVFYENIIAQPHEQIKKLIDFMGIPVAEKKIKQEIKHFSAIAPRKTAKMISGYSFFSDKEKLEMISVIKPFGLYMLYNSKGIPVQEALNLFRDTMRHNNNNS